MTRISWSRPGGRLFETGVDRGVLFVENGVGVPWVGLTGVSEVPTEEEAIVRHQNAVKFYESNDNTDFKATISAYTYPNEFQACDGTAGIGGGLYVDRQDRKRFHMSYRTLIGNEIDGAEHAYRLHLVYNALATPTPKNFVSLSGSVSPNIFTWNISTIPINVPGTTPSAHFVIDSREINKFALATFEEILYGTETTNARMPTIEEVMDLIGQWVTLIITDNGDGTFTAEGPDEVVNMVTDTEFFIDWPSAVYLDDDSYTVSTL